MNSSSTTFYRSRDVFLIYRRLVERYSTQKAISQQYLITFWYIPNIIYFIISYNILIYLIISYNTENHNELNIIKGVSHLPYSLLCDYPRYSDQIAEYNSISLFLAACDYLYKIPINHIWLTHQHQLHILFQW